MYANFVTSIESTISGNTTAGPRANGGGMHTDAGNIRRSTFTNNHTMHSTSQGGGIYLRQLASASTLSISNSILTGNFATTNGVDFARNENSHLEVVYSLIGTGVVPDVAQFCVVTDAPLVGPLASNGGAAKTHALLPGSPALDAGDPAAVAGMTGMPAFDQRGVPWLRVVGGRIDIGAVESQANPLAGDYNFNAVVDSADYSVWRDLLGSTTDLRADGTGAAAGVPDGVVDELDYAFWKANFGNVLVLAESGGDGSSETDSESGAAAGELRLAVEPAGGPIIADNLVEIGADVGGAFSVAPARRSSPAIGSVLRAVGRVRDDALLALFAERRSSDGAGACCDDTGRSEVVNVPASDGHVDEVFAALSLTF
jgi:hypothetical protein